MLTSKDMPHTALKTSLPRCYAGRSAQYTRDEIEHWLHNFLTCTRYCDQYEKRDRHFDGNVFAKDIALLDTLKTYPGQAIRTVARAPGYLKDHVYSCSNKCKMHCAKECDRLLLPLVEEAMGNHDWSEWGSEARLVYRSRQDHRLIYRTASNDGKPSVNMVFPKAMASIRDRHIKATARLVANAVAGAKLPQELVDQIAEHYIADTPETWSQWWTAW